MSDKLAMVSHGGDIDFGRWEWGNEKVLVNVSAELGELMNERLALVFREIVEDSYVYFPVEWSEGDGIGGKPVDNPLTLYLRMAVDESFEYPTFSFDLDDVVRDSIGLHVMNDGKIAKKDQIPIKKLRDGLAKLVKMIDDACEVEQ